MLELYIENSYKKDLKRVVKQGIKANIGADIIYRLQCQLPLDERQRNHALSGDYLCTFTHITPPPLLLLQIFSFQSVASVLLKLPALFLPETP